MNGNTGQRILEALKLEPMTMAELVHTLDGAINSVGQALDRLQRFNRIQVLADKRPSRFGGYGARKLSRVNVYALPDFVTQGAPARSRPRHKAPGSGQIAGPCISRQFVWNRGMVW